jgi:hypothetical protein
MWKCAGYLVAALVTVGGFSWPASVPAARTPAFGRQGRTETETVDFSRPCAAGLKFRLTEVGAYGVEGTVNEDGRPVQQIVQKIDARLSLIQTVLTEANSGNGQIERQYEDFGARVRQERTVDGATRVRTWDQTLPLHGKRVRAIVKDGRFRLETWTREKGWTEAPADVVARLSPANLRHPVLPVPDAVKRVGDTWELSRQDLADYFNDAFVGDPRKIEIQGTGQLTLAAVTEIDGTRAAQLKVAFDVEARLQVSGGRQIQRFQIQGTARYDLTHRLITHLVMDGTMVTESTRQNEGTNLRVNMKGTIKTRSEVTILTSRGEADSGPAR